MPYTVTVTPTSGDKVTYACGGASDQEALIYAGKVVEANANGFDLSASVVIEKDVERIGPPATVAEMSARLSDLVPRQFHAATLGRLARLPSKIASAAREFSYA